jgi:phosphatidylglycerophosphate synthase
VQAVLTIPRRETLKHYGDPAEVLTQTVAGVPLLVRIIATASRAGVDSVLVIWPEDVPFLESCAALSLIKGVRLEYLIATSAFDPRDHSYWQALESRLNENFLWLPWNWVTHKRALMSLASAPVRPVAWREPVMLEKRAVLDRSRLRVSSCQSPAGVAIDSRASVNVAERFLVANSGKPTDGFYSNLNRRLCRPVVRWLTHTPVTPNAVTVAGLLVALVAAMFFARGTYLSTVTGAVLFFVSGLIDEMDGMIARITFSESAFGTWFEGFVDNITYLAVFAGIIAGLYHQHGAWALKYGIALMLGCVLSIVVVAMQRKLATRKDRPHEYAGKINQLMDADSSNLISKVARQIHIFVKKGVLVHYVLIFTVLGGLPVFLWLAAIGSNLFWIGALYFTRRFFRRPFPEPARRDIPTAA